jgi:hypothetical protein
MLVRMTLIGYGTNCPKKTAHAAFEKRSLMLSRKRCTKKMLVNDRKHWRTLAKTAEHLLKKIYLTLANKRLQTVCSPLILGG